MKLLAAALLAIAITVALPAFFSDCSGKAIWVIPAGNLNADTPAALVTAYDALFDTIVKPCASPTAKRSVHKWRSNDGVWHVSDDTASGSTAADSTTIEIQSNLIPREAPVAPSWMPMAITGLCAGLAIVFYLLMWGIESGWHLLHRKPLAVAEEPVIYQERNNAGEAVVFARSTPHEILGIDAKASLAEVEAAYERQLDAYKAELARETNGEMTPEMEHRFLVLHQAYEAMTRKKVDKYLAVVD